MHRQRLCYTFSQISLLRDRSENKHMIFTTCHKKHLPCIRHLVPMSISMPVSLCKHRPEWMYSRKMHSRLLWHTLQCNNNKQINRYVGIFPSPAPHPLPSLLQICTQVSGFIYVAKFSAAKGISSCYSYLHISLESWNFSGKDANPPESENQPN